MHKSGLVHTSDLIKSETYTPPRPSELIKDFPEKYEKIVMRLLEKDKRKRYQNAREVLDEWPEERETVATAQCPRCSTENPVLNKFCGQCGNDLRATREVESEPEKDLSTSFALFTAGRIQDAIGIMERSLLANPDFARGWTHLGYMLNYERRYEEAEFACTKSIDIDPDPSNPYQTRGFSRSNLGKFDEAIEDFTIAYEKETDERRKSMILYQRGYSKRLAGRFEDAYQDAITAIEFDEANPKARRLKESLESLRARQSSWSKRNLHFFLVDSTENQKALFKILARTDKISRPRLIEEMKNETRDRFFDGFKLAGTRAGITMRTNREGKEKLIITSDRGKTYELHSDYKSDINEYFAS